MTIHTLAGFRDENPGLFRSHPLQVIRSAERAQARSPWIDSHDRPGAVRRVLYTLGTSGLEIELVLRMVEHAGGAWNKGAAESPTAGNTEGRILHRDGTMAAAAQVPKTNLQGVLFANYYELHANRVSSADVVTDQGNGDWYWTIVRGYVQLKAGGLAPNDIEEGEALVTAGDAGGGYVQLALSELDDAALANLEATTEQAIFDHGRNLVGYAAVSIGGASLVGVGEPDSGDLFDAVVDLLAFGARFV